MRAIQAPDTNIVWLQSWWLANALRKELEAFGERRIITFELDDGDLR
jgi:hypothetical protein